MRSFPGERATLTNGFVAVFHGADYVTIQNLNIDATGATQNGVQIMGASTVLAGNRITNHNRPHSCIIVGSDTGYGRATNALLAFNTIHQCGSKADGVQDHGIYVDNAVNASIIGNIIWGSAGWGIHLYPDSQGTRVTHNVIDGNGLGIVFGGNGSSSSNYNVVEDNIISNSSIGFNVQEYWGGAVGRGNLADKNCMFNRNGRNIPRGRAGGFSASKNVFANPRYVNQAKHDYRLRSGSPCLRPR